MVTVIHTSFCVFLFCFFKGLCLALLDRIYSSDLWIPIHSSVLYSYNCLQGICFYCFCFGLVLSIRFLKFMKEDEILYKTWLQFFLSIYPYQIYCFICFYSGISCCVLSIVNQVLDIAVCFESHRSIK